MKKNTQQRGKRRKLSRSEQLKRPPIPKIYEILYAVGLCIILAAIINWQNILGRYLFPAGVSIIFGAQTYRDRNEPDLGEHYVSELCMLLICLTALLFQGFNDFMFGKNEGLFDAYKIWTIKAVGSLLNFKEGLQILSLLLTLCGTFYLSMDIIGKTQIKQWFDRLRAILLFFRFRKLTLPELRFRDFLEFIFLMFCALLAVYLGFFGLYFFLQYKTPNVAITIILISVALFIVPYAATLLFVVSPIGILLCILGFAERYRPRKRIRVYGLRLMAVGILLGIVSFFFG